MPCEKSEDCACAVLLFSPCMPFDSASHHFFTRSLRSLDVSMSIYNPAHGSTHTTLTGKSLNCDTGDFFENYKGGKVNKFTWPGVGDTKVPQNVYRRAPGVGTEWGAYAPAQTDTSTRLELCPKYAVFLLASRIWYLC